jgi:putative transposase
MARKVRMEYAGACYHVINRGNYRSWIFEHVGARYSFLECLKTVCESKGWRLHAWCLMGNHYHLLIETVEPNLVEGMAWLQSTFSNRFNRFRNECGHVFQGRYKALVLDEDARLAVCHYIHLNAVRAGIVGVQQLQDYEPSSFHQLWYPQKRWSFGEYTTCLGLTNRLEDDAEGRLHYRQYLEWVSSSEKEQQELGFEKMTRGWAKGSKEFKKELLAGMSSERLNQSHEKDMREMKEAAWQRTVERCMGVLGKDGSDLEHEPKGALWKVAIACYLRETYLTPNAWIATHLKMGAVSSVQSWISRYRSAPSGDVKDELDKLRNHAFCRWPYRTPAWISGFPALQSTSLPLA